MLCVATLRVETKKITPKTFIESWGDIQFDIPIVVSSVNLTRIVKWIREAQVNLKNLIYNDLHEKNGRIVFLYFSYSNNRYPKAVI